MQLFSRIKWLEPSLIPSRILGSHAGCYHGLNQSATQALSFAHDTPRRSCTGGPGQTRIRNHHGVSSVETANRQCERIAFTSLGVVSRLSASAASDSFPFFHSPSRQMHTPVMAGISIHDLMLQLIYYASFTKLMPELLHPYRQVSGTNR